MRRSKSVRKSTLPMKPVTPLMTMSGGLATFVGVYVLGGDAAAVSDILLKYTIINGIQRH